LLTLFFFFFLSFAAFIRSVENTLLYFRGSQAKLPFNIIKLASFNILPSADFREALNFAANDGLASGVDTLLVDFTGNGGGFVVTQALFVQFLSADYRTPSALCEVCQISWC
jgi:hypothetical protein